MPQTAKGRMNRLHRLTPQERECLRLVAEQHSSKEIAHLLGIAKASVDTYCNRARAKLGVTSRREAARLVRDMEEEAAVPVVAAGPDAAVAAPVPPSPGEWSWRAIGRTPRVAALGPMRRLGIILMGASLFALAFGVLVNGLESLNDVVAISRAYAQTVKAH